MTLRRDQRGQSLLWVTVWVVAALLAVWVFTLLYGRVFEPIAEIANNMAAVSDAGYAGHVDLIMATVKMGGLLFGVGAVLLYIVFAVWREQFRGRSPPR